MKVTLSPLNSLWPQKFIHKFTLKMGRIYIRVQQRLTTSHNESKLSHNESKLHNNRSQRVKISLQQVTTSQNCITKSHKESKTSDNESKRVKNERHRTSQSYKLMNAE